MRMQIYHSTIFKILIAATAFSGTTAFADLQDEPIDAPGQKVEPQSKPTDQISIPPPSKAPEPPVGNAPVAKGSGDKKGKKEPPVKFRAESMFGNKNDGQVTLKGNVKIYQEDMVITTDEAIVDQNTKEGVLRTITAKGNVLVQKNEESTGKKMTASSHTAVYIAKDKMLTFKGNARITRGTDVMNGTIIYYNTATGMIKAEKVDGVFKQNE